MDVGGTLTKLVYFEPNDEDEPSGELEAKVLKNIRRYLTKHSAYGNTGHRDIHLQVIADSIICFLLLLLLLLLLFEEEVEGERASQRVLLDDAQRKSKRERERERARKRVSMNLEL